MTCLLFTQVGDNVEVIYLATKTDEERNNWMKEFEKGELRDCMYMYDVRLKGISHRKD